MEFLMLILAGGIVHVRVDTTAATPRKMVAIL